VADRNKLVLMCFVFRLEPDHRPS